MQLPAVTFFVLLLIPAVFTRNQEVLLDDGTHGTRVLVNENLTYSTTEQPPEICEPGQFEDNQQCHTCFPHDAYCNASKQCCEGNMACWRFGYNPPMCKCNPDYAWDGLNAVCYHSPVPAIVVVTAYTAVAASCIIGIAALIFYCASCIKSKCTTHRHQSRNPLRRNNRNSPASRERRLSSMLPHFSADPLPDKPPAYEEIIRATMVSQTMRQPTGSIRSLPPAYSITDDIIVVTTIQPVEAMTPVPGPSMLATSSEDGNKRTEDATREEQGNENVAFSYEIHL